MAPFQEVSDSLKDKTRRLGQCRRLPDRLSQSSPRPRAVRQVVLKTLCTIL